MNSSVGFLNGRTSALITGMALIIDNLMRIDEHREKAAMLNAMNYKACAEQFHTTLEGHAALSMYVDFPKWEELTEHQQNELAAAVQVEYHTPTESPGAALTLLAKHSWLSTLSKTQPIVDLENRPMPFRYAGHTFALIVLIYREQFNSEKD